MAEIIVFAIQFAVSILAFALSIRSFREKGFLWNNAYLFASQKERQTMDKKLYYRQSGLVFLLVGVIFLLNGLSVLLDRVWISYVGIAVTVAAMVYAVVSSVTIEKRMKHT